MDNFFEIHSMNIYNLIIVGSGPAGLTAGMYAGRANLNPIIITGNTFGGMTSKLSQIENYPGFPNSISGKSLISKMKKQAINSGAIFLKDSIQDFYVLKDKIILTGEKQTEYHTKSVIFATGININRNTIKGLKDYLGRGVSTCLHCDGPFYKDKKVAVCGNKENIFEDIKYLSNIAKEVTFITPKDEDFSKILLLKNVKILKNTSILSINGEKNFGFKSITTHDNKNNVQNDLKFDGMFIINNEENNSLLFNNKIDLTKNGFAITKENTCMTNLNGVFVAGDLKNENSKQIINACASGADAANEVKKWLIENKKL